MSYCTVCLTASLILKLQGIQNACARLQPIWLATTFLMSYHPWKETSGADPGIFAQEGPT